MYVCVYSCMYVRTYVCMYVYVYVGMSGSKDACMYICMNNIFPYVQAYVRTYVCMYVREQRIARYV